MARKDSSRNLGGIYVADIRRRELSRNIQQRKGNRDEEIPISYSEKFKDQAIRAVNKAIEMAQNAGLKAQTRVEVGASPADNIVKYAEESKTDLIVMGHGGITGPNRFLIGSVAGRVVAHAPCSVMVVR